MERLSIARRILDLYRDLFLRHPLTLTVVFFVYLLTVLVVLGGLRITFNPRFIRGEPQLEIEIGPTEKYSVANLTVKRIALVNNVRPLDKVRISVRMPDFIEEVNLSTNPQVQCNSIRFGPSAGVAILEITCASFTQNQRVEVALATTKSIGEKGSVVVEVVGSYGRDRLVGVSTTGTFD